jgi:hypothetical protein
MATLQRKKKTKKASAHRLVRVAHTNEWGRLCPVGCLLPAVGYRTPLTNFGLAFIYANYVPSAFGLFGGKVTLFAIFNRPIFVRRTKCGKTAGFSRAST